MDVSACCHAIDTKIMKRIPSFVTLAPHVIKRLTPLLPISEPVLKGSKKIHVCEPNLSKKEKQYLIAAYDSSWISSGGSFVNRFEDAFAKTISHTKAAVAVNSGTSALHLAIASLGIQPGDEVIIPTFTMIATANAVRYCGATPVFIDADRTSWNMDTTQISRAITRKTKAIIVVHTYGSPADMDPIIALAKKHNLWIIEDAAEAHGATYKGKAIGSIGDVAAFSLYANKLVTTGEGGIVTTNNQKLAARMRLLRNHTFTEDRHFWHPLVGFGYRMSNMQAAVGLAQTERFEKLFAAKRANAALYTRLLSDVAGLTLPTEMPHTTHSYWMYGILIHKTQFGMDRNSVRRHLADHGIETRSFFVPIHLQPPYFSARASSFPVAEHLCAQGLYLPSSTTLTKQDIKTICAILRSLQQS
jgi:perosamine synthetase